jgi:hypothetical protein
MKVFESLYLQRLAGTLSETGWEARESTIRNWIIRSLPDDDDLYSGSISPLFLEYIREVRADSAP